MRLGFPPLRALTWCWLLAWVGCDVSTSLVLDISAAPGITIDTLSLALVFEARSASNYTLPVGGGPLRLPGRALIRVPTGGTQLLILNSEFRIPVPLKKGLSLVPFYDGGNVFDKIGFSRFSEQYTNSVGIGFRYATPVGPVRLDIGHNLNSIPGVKATQIFITLGQAF